MSGPIQLMVIGFDQPEFTGAIGTELDKLRASGMVRVIDLLAVHKNLDGTLETMQSTDLDLPEMEDMGATVGALLGFGAGGPEGAEAGAARGAQAASSGHLFSGARVPDVAAAMPADSAAAVVLLEHQWASPLRDAVAQAGGFPVADTWVRPADLIAVGAIADEV